MVKSLQEPGPCSLPGPGQERISSESQFCFLCGFVMIMIAMVIFYFILFYWSVSNSKRQKRQRHRHREWRRRGWLIGHRTWRDGHCSPHLFLVNTWKAEEAFQPFHPEKWNLRNKSRPAQLTLRSSPNSRDSRGGGGARVLTANLRSCCFRPSRIEVGCYCL